MFIIAPTFWKYSIGRVQNNLEKKMRHDVNRKRYQIIGHGYTIWRLDRADKKIHESIMTEQCTYDWQSYRAKNQIINLTNSDIFTVIYEYGRLNDFSPQSAIGNKRDHWTFKYSEWTDPSRIWLFFVFDAIYYGKLNRQFSKIRYGNVRTCASALTLRIRERSTRDVKVPIITISTQR